MNFAAEMQSVSEQLVTMAKKGGKSTSDAERKLQEAREGLDLARVEWHTFSLKRVESSLNDVFGNLRKAREQVLSSESMKGSSYQDEGKAPSHHFAVSGGGSR